MTPKFKVGDRVVCHAPRAAHYPGYYPGTIIRFDADYFGNSWQALVSCDESELRNSYWDIDVLIPEELYNSPLYKALR